MGEPVRTICASVGDVRFGVVVPTYEEASYIGRTVSSLGEQHFPDRSHWELEIVVVDTPGTDGTPEVALAAAPARPDVSVTVLAEREPSMVTARITGFNYLLGRSAGPPDVLVSADADTVFPADWIMSIARMIEAGSAIVSSSGCFEHEFWRRCPRLATRYRKEVGDVFFGERTASEFDDEQRPLFGREVFERFGRPLSDCGFAITVATYRALGGIQHETYDAAGAEPILAVGWPLMFRAEMSGVRVDTLWSPEYETSARRLVNEPDALLSGASYRYEVANYRAPEESRHAWIERMAPRLDMNVLRHYVVKNYIMQQCAIRPERITGNADFLGPCAEPLAGTVEAWRQVHPRPAARDVFAFAEALDKTFGEDLVHHLRLRRFLTSNTDGKPQ